MSWNFGGTSKNRAVRQQPLGLSVDRETNLVAVAQYHLNERRNRTRINQKIIDEFSSGHTLNENHEVLARLPIATYWTTNYDRMIETADQPRSRSRRYRDWG